MAYEIVAYEIVEQGEDVFGLVHNPEAPGALVMLLVGGEWLPRYLLKPDGEKIPVPSCFQPKQEDVEALNMLLSQE